jgi:hypothetical protein
MCTVEGYVRKGMCTGNECVQERNVYRKGICTRQTLYRTMGCRGIGGVGRREKGERKYVLPSGAFYPLSTLGPAYRAYRGILPAAAKGRRKVNENLGVGLAPVGSDESPIPTTFVIYR